MNITIRNVSFIREARFTIHPITIVCGQSCTGKSLVLDSIREGLEASRGKILSSEYRHNYVQNALGTILMREGTMGLAVSFTDKTCEIRHTGSDSEEYFTNSVKCVSNTYEPMTECRYIDELPAWLLRQILQDSQSSEGNEFLKRNMGISLSVQDAHSSVDPKHMVSIMVDGLFPVPVSLNQAVSLQRCLFNILRISDTMQYLHNRIQRVVVLIKNPECGLSPRYVRQYVNTIWDMYKTYSERGLTVNFVIETQAPHVLTQTISQIQKRRCPANAFIAYGMDWDDRGFVYPRLKGHYHAGYLVDWKTGFLSL